MKDKKIKKLKTTSLKFLNILEESIEKKIDDLRLNATIDDEKELQFYESSRDAIVEAFKKFEIIQNSLESFEKEPTISFGVNGSMNLFQKSAFTTGDIPHMNADSILSEQIIFQSINNYIPNTFLSARKKRYLLRKDDLVKGIDKLGFNADNDIIVAMNLNIYGIKDFEKFENKIVRIPSTGLRNVLYLLPKVDLPIIRHKDLEIKEQKEHQLGILDDNKKVYASLIDLTVDDNSKHREKWNKTETDFTKDLRVQLTIAFIAEVVWKAKANVIQINIENSMEEQGIVNEISDLERFENKEEV